MITAARHGSYENVERYLKSGVHPDITYDVDEYEGWTALQWAAYCGKHDVVRLLLEHGANPTLVNDLGQSPLNLALIRGHSQCIALLTTALVKHEKNSKKKQAAREKSSLLSKTQLSSATQNKTDVKVKLCWNCHANESDDVKLLKCGGCKKARYCDQECQAQDWSRHQEHCQPLQERKRNKKSQMNNRHSTS